MIGAVKGSDVKIASLEGRDYFIAGDGDSKFSSAEFEVTPGALGVAKEYQAFTPMGDDAWLIYTGHFIPWVDGQRMEASFKFRPADGQRVSAFGNSAQELNAWKSPFDHPAFVYFGASAPADANTYAAVVDQRAPIWIKTELASFTPKLLEALEAAFARQLSVQPNIFLSYPGGGTPGQLKYSGDALPGQSQMTLIGEGWTYETAIGRRLLRYATAHEAVHLWQANARPATVDAPDWIHEGAADAIAREILVSMALWDEKKAAAALTKAKHECAAAIRGASVDAAIRGGVFRASYACGHVLNVAAAGEAGVIAFWREFEAAAAENGYDKTLFLKTAADVSGQEQARRIERFLVTKNAHPDQAIDALLENRL